MSEHSNEDDKNIKVYENDEAYMFGDNNSNNNSNPNEEGILNENDLQENNQINDKKESNLNPIQEKITPENIQDETIRNKQNENININNNENYENEEEEEEQNSQEQGTNEEGESDSIPLITLNYISICQCCKNPFNSTINIPYLFKCGHFFCKKCIEEQFTDEEGIKCPNDGLIAYSIKELKLLNNLITDKYVESNTQREGFLNNS